MNTSVSVHFLNSAWPPVFIQKLGTHTLATNCVLLRKDVDVGVRLGWVPAEALPLTRCGDLGKSHLSALQFSHLQRG